MTELFGWVALATTCLAAIVTAANLGARITGYGFAIFFVGAIAWCAVAAATGQQQLLWSNAFLALVDLLGVWRWLYRRAQAEDAVARSKDELATDNLFALEEIVGKPVFDEAGNTLAVVEGALTDGKTGTLQFLVVRPDGAIADASTFRRLPWRACRQVSGDKVIISLSSAEFERLPAS